MVCQPFPYSVTLQDHGSVETPAPNELCQGCCKCLGYKPFLWTPGYGSLVVVIATQDLMEVDLPNVQHPVSFGVAIGEGLLLGRVFVINWCFCKHYSNVKWRPHLKRINMFFD